MTHRAIHAAIIVTTLLAAHCAHAAEFTSLGDAGGWDDINKGKPVTALLDVSDYTTDIPAAAVEMALTNAFGTWDAVETAPGLVVEFVVDDGGNYDVFDGPNDSAGPTWFNGTSSTLDQNAQWRYSNIAIGGWLPVSYFGNPNILAVTWTGRLSGDGSRKPAWHSEIYFNDAWAWTDDVTIGGGIDLETVALHEVGHALGLAHENDVPSVMASYYDGVSRTLFDDDIAGISTLYAGSTKGGGKGGGNGGGRGKPNKMIYDDVDWYLTGVTYYDASMVVPEPATLILLSLCGPMLLRRKRR